VPLLAHGCAHERRVSYLFWSRSGGDAGRRVFDSNDASNDGWRIGRVAKHTVAAEPQQDDENSEEEGA